MTISIDDDERRKRGRRDKRVRGERRERFMRILHAQARPDFAPYAWDDEAIADDIRLAFEEADFGYTRSPTHLCEEDAVGLNVLWHEGAAEASRSIHVRRRGRKAKAARVVRAEVLPRTAEEAWARRPPKPVTTALQDVAEFERQVQLPQRSVHVNELPYWRWVPLWPALPRRGTLAIACGEHVARIAFRDLNLDEIVIETEDTVSLFPFWTLAESEFMAKLVDEFELLETDVGKPLPRDKNGRPVLHSPYSGLQNLLWLFRKRQPVGREAHLRLLEEDRQDYLQTGP